MPDALRPTSPEQSPELPARLEDLAAEVVTYAEEAKAEETRRVYRLGFEDFRSFCEEAGTKALPASPETVALYLAERAGALSVSSLEQRLAAIRHAHLPPLEDRPGRQGPDRGRPPRRGLEALPRLKPRALA